MEDIEVCLFVKGDAEGLKEKAKDQGVNVVKEVKKEKKKERCREDQDDLEDTYYRWLLFSISRQNTRPMKQEESLLLHMIYFCVMTEWLICCLK